MSTATMLSCTHHENPKLNMTAELASNIKSERTDTATFGTGCFWCTEAIFQELDGVSEVTSGYSGGHKENPTYKEVCTGETGHTECVQVFLQS